MRKKDLLLIVLFVGILFFSINVSADPSDSINCSSVISSDLTDALHKYVYVPIKWLTPLALLVLTSLDFASVVLSGDKKGMDKAKNNFLKRSVAALIIFFAPNIIDLVIGWLGQNDVGACVNQISGS